jgi:hypothetical protein
MHAALVTMTVVLVRLGFLMQEMPMGGHQSRTALACGVAMQTEAVISTLAFPIRPSIPDVEPTWLSHTANKSIPMRTLQTRQPGVRQGDRADIEKMARGEHGGELAWWRVGMSIRRGIHWPPDVVHTVWLA